MKKVLLFLLCLVLVASVVEAKIVKDSIYQIPKTAIAPVIDGEQDAVWKSIDWNMQRYYTVDGTAADSGAGLCGMSKVMWDANNIYVLFYTIDDAVMPIPTGNNYDQDGLELYFDGANDKTNESSLKPTQYHLTFPYWLIGQEVGHLGYAFGTTFDTAGCEFKIRDMTDTEGFPGWMIEVKIPLLSLGIDGPSADNQLIGFELQQNEGDNGTSRQSMSKWWNNTNSSWQNAGIWGTAILSNRVVDTVFEINKLVGTTITIDGNLDPIYRQANTITTNLFRVDAAASPAGVNTDPMFGGFITEYPVWDANNLYIFCDVVDPVLVDKPTVDFYQTDAVEIYFDGSNDHSQKGSRGATQYQFTFPHWMIGQEPGKLGRIFPAGFDTTGIEFKFKDRDVRGNDGVLTEEGSGYNLEVKIPLLSLGVDGASADGQLVGWELQQDNNDDPAGDRQDMQKWWSASNMSWANPGIWGTAKLGSAIVTSVHGKPSSVVSGYKLEQNYPNPFNPSTKITFELAKSMKVKLAVYNLLGEQVAVLVDGTRNAGPQTVTFDAKNFSSGVYFYKLDAGSTVLTKKMMLLK